MKQFEKVGSITETAIQNIRKNLPQKQKKTTGGLEKSTVSNFVKQYGTPLQFESKFNPSFQIKLRSINAGYVECSAYKYPSLSKLREVYGTEVAAHWIEVQIDNLNDFCNVGNKMSAEQKFEASCMIVFDYHYLNISEIALFFSYMKSGKFGEFYGCVDGIRILTALRKFCAERFQAIERSERHKKSDMLDNNFHERIEDGVSREEYLKMKPLLREKAKINLKKKRLDGMKMRCGYRPSWHVLEYVKYLSKI